MTISSISKQKDIFTYNTSWFKQLTIGEIVAQKGNNIVLAFAYIKGSECNFGSDFYSAYQDWSGASTW